MIGHKFEVVKNICGKLFSITSIQKFVIFTFTAIWRGLLHVLLNLVGGTSEKRVE